MKSDYEFFVCIILEIFCEDWEESSAFMKGGNLAK